MAGMWKEIPGYPGYYVSDKGEVLSGPKPHRTWSKVLSPDVNRQGYRRVYLYIDGKRRRRSVHQLVCETFHGPRPPGAVVRHLDGNPANNAPENVTWGTYSENCDDTLRHGRNFFSNKTHCPQGHPYDATNTEHTSQGRKCRECHRERSRRYYRRKVAARQAAK